MVLKRWSRIPLALQLEKDGKGSDFVIGKSSARLLPLNHLLRLLTHSLFQADTAGLQEEEAIAFRAEFVSGLVLAFNSGVSNTNQKAMVGADWAWLIDFHGQVSVLFSS